MNKVEQKTDWATWGLVVAAAVLILLGMFLPACGNPGQPTSSEPRVEVLCDDAACTVLVWNATSVFTEYDGYLAWFEDDISNPEDRQTYRDKRPAQSIQVTACNDTTCVEVYEDLAQYAEKAPERVCFGDSPGCPYGRIAVCWKGTWYCVANHDQFRRSV